VADLVDIFQADREVTDEAALKNVRARVQPESHPDFDGAHCVECGNDMPPERLAWGRVRCTPCQHVLEFNKRMGVA